MRRMKLSLTSFQVECETDLTSALAAHGRTLVERAVQGERERYVVALISRSRLMVYIYGNGADLQGPGVDERFEAADYDSLGALSRAFIDACLTQVGYAPD
jgi:hypothetical protein